MAEPVDQAGPPPGDEMEFDSGPEKIVTLPAPGWAVLNVKENGQRGPEPRKMLVLRAGDTEYRVLFTPRAASDLSRQMDPHGIVVTDKMPSGPPGGAL